VCVCVSECVCMWCACHEGHVMWEWGMCMRCACVSFHMCWCKAVLMRFCKRVNEMCSGWPRQWEQARGTPVLPTHTKWCCLSFALRFGLSLLVISVCRLFIITYTKQVPPLPLRVGYTPLARRCTKLYCCNFFHLFCRCCSVHAAITNACAESTDGQSSCWIMI
jgi:hypothetical protein